MIVASSAGAQVFVQGYTTKNGTYVAPHYRSAPDSNPYNNWSVKPNVNPYTGKMGTKSPYGGPYTRPTFGSPSFNCTYCSSNQSQSADSDPN